MLSYPCKPCVPGPCMEYACLPSCSDVDPYLIPFTLSNLTLTPGYHTNQSDDSSINPFNNGYSLSSFFTSYFQPAVYYVAVKAIAASGQEVVGTSNGIIIDITPPQLIGLIEHFDVEFSPTQPTEFQGNNHTIAAKWQFVDLESDVINYDWAIGSYPGGDDIQGYVSLGLATSASNTSLEGYLMHNNTYYVTVRATNGALLVKEATSSGITFIATDLNSSALELIVEVSHFETFEFRAENVTPVILRTDRTDSATVSWKNVSDDVSQICKCLPHYATLYHTTLHYTTLHCTTSHHTTPHHTTPHHITPHHTTPHHTTPHHTTPHHICMHIHASVHELLPMYFLQFGELGVKWVVKMYFLPLKLVLMGQNQPVLQDERYI